MSSREERDRVISKVVKLIYNAGANSWPVADKGLLAAAVKMQLQEKPKTQEVDSE